VEKKNFFMEGMFLYLKGKCQPKQWRQNEFEVKVNTIELLPDVKEEVIEQLTISAPLSEINDEFIAEFSSLVKAHPGKVTLNFYVKDDEGQHISLTSKNMKINVQKDIIAYLKEQTMLSYKIN
jgi:DNA polymerase-3 subunit alpha